MLLLMILENWDLRVGEVFWGDSEGCLNKMANEYCTEVAIPHVLSSKEYTIRTGDG
jgi:hypothetical protein